MTLREIDPLLAIGMAIVTIGQQLMVIAGLALVLMIPALFLFEASILAELRAEFADPAFALPIPELAGIMLLVLAAVALLFLFLMNLRRIIRTVGDGDPFVPINAQRLTAMAWLMLAIELLTIPMAVLGMYLMTVLDPAEGEIREGFDYDFSGIILVVTLFILARVFRKGAQMREDLEGTV